jgi:glycosyltransferase involved in cell wall biosynthesis
MRIVWLPTARPHWIEKMSGVGFAALRELSGPAPDIIHFHAVGPGAAAALLRRRGIPSVTQLHGVEWKRSRWGWFGKSTIRLLENCAFRGGHMFTAVSKAQCALYSNKYGVPIEYIPTAADIKPNVKPHLLESTGLTPRRYVLFASRLVPEKGAHYLIRAFNQVHANLDLAIAGGGPPSSAYVTELRRLASGNSRIRFLGHVTGQLLDELFSNARMFVQPSELEGLAIALIEGMAAGVACIASDIPENLEAIGNTGVSFHSGDCDDLAAKMRWILDHPDRADELGARARARVAECYSWDRVTDALENLYDRAIASSLTNRRHALPHP